MNESTTTMLAGALFHALRSRKVRGGAAFIPYLTAGDPSFDYTTRAIEGLVGLGADIIELGVPFSDPIADGPAIQQASERALAKGATLEKILEYVANLRARNLKIPILLFSYYNPILRMGLDSFAWKARQAAVQGVLVVDLPPEEADEYLAAMRPHGLDTVFLAAPTTTPARFDRIDSLSTAFVYYVSRMGVTGAKEAISPTLAEELKGLRKSLTKPLAVGFGISTPQQAAALAPLVEGVVVGSVLVDFFNKFPPEEALSKMLKLAKEICDALHTVPTT